MIGNFYVIEGLDGAGTTTQSRLLASRIQSAGYRVCCAKEPSGPIEKIVRETIHEQDNHWPLPWYFAASRAYLLTRVEPLLKDGVHVVCDRFTLSSLAYQSLDHDMDFIWGLNSKFRQADLTIYLDVPVPTCLDRLSTRSTRDPFETSKVLTQAGANYTIAMRLIKERTGTDTFILDGTEPTSVVAEHIWELVSPTLVKV